MSEVLRPVRPPWWTLPEDEATVPDASIRDRMLGEPAGWIPPAHPPKWVPMLALGDAEHVVHCVPSGMRALCGYASDSGWQWARGEEVTCEACWRRQHSSRRAADVAVKLKMIDVLARKAQSLIQDLAWA
jgi:hypothetical protein